MVTESTLPQPKKEELAATQPPFLADAFPSFSTTQRCAKGIILFQIASQSWDDAIPEADNSKERAEKIDKF